MSKSRTNKNSMKKDNMVAKDVVNNGMSNEKNRVSEEKNKKNKGYENSYS